GLIDGAYKLIGRPLGIYKTLTGHAHKTARRFSPRIIGRGKCPELGIVEVAAPENQRRPVGAAVVLNFDDEAAVIRQDNAVAIERENLIWRTVVTLHFERSWRHRTDSALGAEQRRTVVNLIRLSADDSGAGVQDDQMPRSVGELFHPNLL